MSEDAVIRTFQTTCVLDCPDACSLEVTVRDGIIDRIEGNKEHPLTRGFICSKVRRFAHRVYHPDRILHPMRRRGAKGEGDFVRISWEEAIEEITGRFREIVREHGGEAILPYHYGGSNGFLTDELTDYFFFARLGASRLAKTICAAPTTEVATGMYGKMAGVAFPDYAEARCILIWGANPKASNIHLLPFLSEAKRRGAFIATIDPIGNLPSELVDLHLPVYPGADLPVALAMIRLWNEQGRLDREFLERNAVGLETLLDKASAWSVERAAEAARVPAADIRRLAEVYADSHPALLRCGWGLERNRNGGQAVAAVLSFPALLGKFGVRGGGYTLSNSGAGRLRREQIGDLSFWRSRVINMTELARALNGPLDPPVKALFVYNCNPVASVPDQNALLDGLGREDLFTVVFDQVMTDTAQRADLVLPATTFFEHHDLRRSYGSYAIGVNGPIVSRQGESRSNHEVFAALGRAMGFSDPVFSWSAERLLQRTWEAIERDGEPLSGRAEPGSIHPYAFPGGAPIQFGTVFPRTPDRKVHLAPAALGGNPFHFEPVSSDGYPLALVSPATSKTINSTCGEWNLAELRVLLHPDDAASRGLRDGDLVRVFNAQGEVHCPLRLSYRMRPGVAMMPKGAWMKSSRNARTATALTPSHVSAVGGGACFNDARVEVAPLS